MAETADVTTYTVKQALAVKAGDHVEIAIEAEDGGKLKLRATPERLDALVGDLEVILADADGDAGTAGA